MNENNANFTPAAPNFKTLVRMSFQGLTNFPYIEEDFDALTNYGLLSKIVEYLNEVISNNNKQNTLMTNLYNAYVSLQDYVNNYFDNLDVQDEINTKLDNMANTGELTTLIKKYIDPIYLDFENEINSDISNYKASINTTIQNQNSTILGIQNELSSIASGTPTPVSSISDMTDTTKAYLLTTDGNWYYYDGEAWTSGGTYQATGLARNEIKNGNIYKNITDDKRILIDNLFSLAESVQENTRLTGFNVSLYVPTTASDNTCTTATFDVATLLSYTDYLGYSLPPSTSAQAMIYYTDGVKATNRSREGCLTTNAENFYDDTNKLYYKKIITGYEKVAITFPKFDEIIFIPHEKSLYLKSIENTIDINPNNKFKDFNIKNTNILLYADEIKENTRLSGYNQSYAPTTQGDPTSYVAYFTVSNIPSQLLTDIYYQVNIDNNNDNMIIFYNQGVSATNRTKDNITNSADYDSTTNYYKIPTTYFADYTKFAISISYSDTVLSLYSDLWNEGNPNYTLINNPNIVEEVVLPSNVYVLNNHSYSLYYNNCLKYGNAPKYQKVQVTGAFTLNTPNCSIYTPNETGTKQARYSIYKNNDKDLYLGKYFNYVVVPESAGSGTTKKVLMIGDSLTDSNKYLQTINSLMNIDSMNVTFLGTLDSSPNLNEGRSGWRAYTYCNCEYGSDESTDAGFFQGINPFYNPSTSSFDFSYYMLQNNYSSVDYVFINLGTNDVARGDHNTEEDIIGYYTTMINSIKSFNANIKIALWLPPTRGTLNNITGRETNDNAVFKMQKYLIDNFDNSQVSNVYIYNSSLMINPEKDYTTRNITVAGEVYTVVNDTVHPADSGYEKIGYATYYMIKYLASL